MPNTRKLSISQVAVSELALRGGEAAVDRRPDANPLGGAAESAEPEPCLFEPSVYDVKNQDRV